MSNIETRKAGAVRIEQTEPQPGEPLRLNGIAANWERYDMGNCYERLEPTCFDASIKADGDKIALLWNHDTAKPMGRVSAGNLKVYSDRSGLCFECDLPDTDTSEEAHALVRAGIVTQCSFGFICLKETYEPPAKGETKGTRVVQLAKLLEVSVVTFPANPATSVEARAEQPKAKKRKIYLPPQF
jgi:HK97 family phage prohead protease